MSKTCASKFCSSRLYSGSVYFYCCNPRQMFCKECRGTAKCNTCNEKILDKSIIYKACSTCERQRDLLGCECIRFTCKGCQSQHSKCGKCKMPFRFIEIGKTSSLESKKNRCQRCSKQYSSCVCAAKSSPSSIKKPQRHQCSKCYKKEFIDDLFCNFCGHFYCKDCLRSISKCVERTCNNIPIEKPSNISQKPIVQCLICETELPEDESLRFGPDKNVCVKCRFTVIDVQQSTAPQPSTQLQPKQLNPQSNGQTNAQPKKQEVSENSASAPQNICSNPEQVPKEVDSSDNIPNGVSNHVRLPHIAHQKPEIPQQDKTDAINSTPVKKSQVGSADSTPFSSVINSAGQIKNLTDSKIISQPSTPIPCVLCNVKYLPRQLFTINCQNRHMMCGCCALSCRRNKCQVCYGMEQNHLNKYFCNKQLETDDDKNGYILEIDKKGQTFCWSCYVVVEKSKIIEQKGKVYCRACVIKLK